MQRESYSHLLIQSGAMSFDTQCLKQKNCTVMIIGSFVKQYVQELLIALDQCFSTAGPRLGTGPWHQLNRAARGSPGICHFSLLSNFQE